jgi:glycine cleavage system H protein
MEPNKPEHSKPPLGPVVPYKRSRFQTRLPAGRLYSQSHFWLMEAEPGLWRVGFTRFATRMLGDLVEHGFEVKVGDDVKVGQTIGWVEGFKAMTDVYCVADGTFAGANPELESGAARVDSDPYGTGWLYAVRGKPDPNATPVDGYIQLLDATIDKMQGKA